MTTTIISKSIDDTYAAAALLAMQLKRGDVVCLSGDLGSGKTTFTQGLAKALKIDPRKVCSPTFVILNIYEGKMPLFHFDLYRLERPEDIHGIGYEEFFYGQGIAVVEWPERLGSLMPKEYWSVILEHVDETQRKITITAS